MDPQEPPGPERGVALPARAAGRGPKRRWRWLGGPALGGAVVLLVLAAAGLPLGQEFSVDLPPGVPSTSGWQKVSGSAELTDGTASVRYEFYVNPAHAARYDVIRYRIVGWDDGPGGMPYPPTERLQWQAGDNDLRRYECVPPQSLRPCAWRQMERNSAEYHGEMPVILWVLSVHRGLLQGRGAGR